jgi:hypothetical protein
MNHSNRCQFGNCQRRAKEREISYYDRPGHLLTLRPRICNEHFGDLLKTNGPATLWLKRLRLETNGLDPN